MSSPATSIKQEQPAAAQAPAEGSQQGAADAAPTAMEVEEPAAADKGATSGSGDQEMKDAEGEAAKPSGKEGEQKGETKTGECRHSKRLGCHSCHLMLQIALYFHIASFSE